MNIKWRLSILGLQMLILISMTWFATGRLFNGETWFLAGLFAVVINPTLLEPYYPRPADVIGNTLIALFLAFITPKTITKLPWDYFIILLFIALILSVISVIFGSIKNNKTLTSIAKAANIICREATALRIYSVVFFLALIEAFPKFEKPFWLLVLSWFLIYFLLSINWQRAWSRVV